MSQQEGKAEKIVALARTLGVRYQDQFLTMTHEELSRLHLPASYLLADTYFNQAKALYGENKKYFCLESPEENGLVGVYALAPVGVLMDWVSLEDWEHAAQLYSQMTGRTVNTYELRTVLRGALPIPCVSKLIARLVAQVYLAERTLGQAA